ncbi:MAG TPA: FG-GAP-like repeat-containing protein [Cyclobacteriaceae bacterium]|nr:FG-GAP-like repeat-containing protein [Cyclobacteriaceae bacterium]
MSKIERLKRRLSELRTQIRLAAAGAAAGILMMAGQASAQTPVSTNPIGPFVNNPLENPLPPPPFRGLDYSTIEFVDLDNDGDLDAVQSWEYHTLYYYINQGTKERASYPREQPELSIFSEVFLPGTYSNRTRPKFADVDDDGDMDMLVGQDYTEGGGGTQYMKFYRNSPDENGMAHFVDPQEHNPFDEIGAEGLLWPVFADIDNDGDQDLILAGDYYNELAARHDWIQFFRNDKNSNAFDVDPTFTQLKGPDNPFRVEGPESSGYVVPAFADMDEDGDVDFIYSTADGKIHYRRNDNGTFIEQTDIWAYNANNPGSSTGNPFGQLHAFISGDKYKAITMADLDNDGDSDMVIGRQDAGENGNESSFAYLKNTGHGTMVYDVSYSNPVIGSDFGYNSAVSLVDYDKDGDLDIVISSTSFGIGENPTSHLSKSILRNDDGEYVPLIFTLDPFQDVQASEGKMHFIDPDQDGDLDILIASEKENSIPKYFINNNGTYVELMGPDNPFSFLGSLNPVDFDFADLDNDGVEDMVAGETGRRLAFYKNTITDGAPTFTKVDEWTNGSFSNLYHAVHPRFIDIDNDGDWDIVVGKYSSAVWYYENQGSNTEPQFMEHADAHHNPNDPNVLLNPFTAIKNTEGSVSPTFIDLDKDGDKDVLFGDFLGQFTYYENQNPAPVVTKTVSNLQFSADHPVLLDPGMTLTDTDNDKIVRIEVRLEPFQPGTEKLQVGGSTPPGLAYEFDDQTGVLSIFGAGDIAAYQAALRQIEYVYTGTPLNSIRKKGRADSNGRSFFKSIIVTTLDADLTIGPSNINTFFISHTNEAPALTPNSFTATYNNAPLAFVSTAAVADSDDSTLASAEVSFSTASYNAAEDRLSATGTSNITATFNSTTGVLQLTGSASPAEYQTVIRSVIYNNLQGASANNATRTLTVKVNDGENDSNIATITLTVLNTTTPPPPPVNSPPAITGAANSFWATGNLVINNTLVVTDPNDQYLVGATVTIASGYVPAEDRLLFTSKNGITGDFSNGTLTLTGTALVTDYQAALRSVQYSNMSATPTTTDRSITFTVNDGKATTQLPGSIITINKPPLITGEDKRTDASGNIAFAISQLLTDPDNNLDLNTLVVKSASGGKVIVENGIITIDYSAVPNFQGRDQLSITVCDAGGRCNTTLLNVDVGASERIYSGFSPNGDGINEWFQIDFLPEDTQVAVYNRWGEIIFETSNYDINDPKNRFEGKNKNGNDVLSGSYFYKIKFPDGRIRTGSLLLNR